MVHAKNNDTASAFVKVIQRKLLASFLRTRCSFSCTTSAVFSELHDQLSSLERHA